MSDGVAERLRGRNCAITVTDVLVNVFGVVVVRVNSTIPEPGPARRGRIEYVDRRSFGDMLIFKRRQYLPDLCNDLLYSGVRFLRKI